MEASLKCLLELFRSTERFVIPEFQRPYCWTQEEIEQLWSDLYEAWQDAIPVLQAGKDPEDYFLGPVVVARRREDMATVAAVVDGQQRLTTLQALLWAARRRLDSGGGNVAEARAFLDSVLLTPGGKSLLAVARGDQANFLNLQQKDSTLDETRDLGRAGTYLRNKIADLPDAESVIRFVQFVLREVSVILVQTDSYSAAWDLFIGLNGKGRPLNAADLIKAFVCGASGDGAVMADIWQEKVLPLGQDATSALLDITRVATGDTGSEAKLFKSFEKAWGERKITAPLLSDGAAAYQQAWRTHVDELSKVGALGMDSLTRRHLRGLRTLDRRDHSSLLLALATVYGPGAPLDPLLVRAFEAYQLWMAMRGKRGRERDFTGLASLVYASRPSFVEARQRIRALLERLAPSKEEARAAVQSASYPGRHMKFIVTQYEEGIRGDITVSDIEYEHMMPQTPTSYWTAAGWHQRPERLCPVSEQHR